MRRDKLKNPSPKPTRASQTVRHGESPQRTKLGGAERTWSVPCTGNNRMKTHLLTFLRRNFDNAVLQGLDGNLAVWLGARLQLAWPSECWGPQPTSHFQPRILRMVINNFR